MNNLTIEELQIKLITEFAPLQGERALLIEQIMEMGQEICLPATDKTADHLIEGCLSKVWLIPSYRGDHIFFKGDSNALMTRGLLALFIRIFSGQPAKDIMEATLSFTHQIGLNMLMSSQRQNGATLIFRKIQEIAKQYIAIRPQ